MHPQALNMPDRRNPAVSVLPTRHEVLWKDGSAVGLQPVQVLGAPHKYLRALPGADAMPIVVDLRELAPSLAEDIPRALPRDLVGLVFYTLRHRYSSAADFTAAARLKGKPLADVQQQVALQAAA
jgi:hypothetical protein